MIHRHLARLISSLWRIFYACSSARCTGHFGCKLCTGATTVLAQSNTSRFKVRKKFRVAGRLARLLWLACTLCWSLIFICCLTIYYTDPQRYEYSVPNTCVEESCRIVPPLHESELNPNLLMILIHASVTGAKRRETIRLTWLNEVINGDISSVQYRFLLGGSSVNPDELQQLKEESEKYGDLIILPGVTDSRMSLTQRTLYGFKHVYEHYRFDYVLKCDDDTYVDVFRVASELQRRPSKERLYWGGYWGKGKILFIGTYRETQWTLCDRYLPYAYGGGYILSRDLIQLLVENAPQLKQYKSEDVSMGAWLSLYNIERKHDARLNTGGYSRGCKWPYLISHKVAVGDIYKLHNALTVDGVFGSQRTYYHRYHGHLYNWTALPSDCCRSNPEIP